MWQKKRWLFSYTLRHMQTLYVNQSSYRQAGFVKTIFRSLRLEKTKQKHTSISWPHCMYPGRSEETQSPPNVQRPICQQRALICYSYMKRWRPTWYNIPTDNSLGTVKSEFKDEWVGDLWFYILFNNILVISGRWAGDYENLCTVEPCLWLKRSPPQIGLKPGTARSVG